MKKMASEFETILFYLLLSMPNMKEVYLAKINEKQVRQKMLRGLLICEMLTCYEVKEYVEDKLK